MILTENDYMLWLKQPVYSKGIHMIPRYSVLKIFSEDLIQAMKKIGYPMSPAYKGIHTVGNWLYRIHCRASVSDSIKLSYPKPTHRDWEEDYENFLSIVNYDWIQEYSLYWNDVDTFDPNTRAGKETWEEFPMFLYTYCNIDESKHAAYVESSIYGAENEDYSSDYKKKDIYIVEMEKGYHGDGWGR